MVVVNGVDFDQVRDINKRSKENKPPSPPIRDPNNNMTSGQKWWVSIIAGILAGLIFSPLSYSLTGEAVKSPTGQVAAEYGKGSIVGLIVRSVILALLIRLILF